MGGERDHMEAAEIIVTDGWTDAGMNMSPLRNDSRAEVVLEHDVSCPTVRHGVKSILSISRDQSTI